MFNNKQKEAIGLGAVSGMVQGGWGCGWQEYDHRNDDGIDGVILMRRGISKPFDTGGLVFVQVKCGGDGYRQDQKQHPDKIGVALSREYIEAHRERWSRVAGPAVLVFVDDTISWQAPPSWWVDLRDEDSYSKTNKGMILIPKTQRFGRHTKGIFHAMCGSGPVDRELPIIALSSEENMRPKLGKGESLRRDAWEFYKNWRGSLLERTNPTLGPIAINRVGWKHMTRAGRSSDRIVQSWLLLGAAKKILKNVSRIDCLGRAEVKDLKEVDDHAKEVTDYLGLRAIVVFPHRHSSVVQVILKRSRIISPNLLNERTKIWFYSVYERRRGQVSV